MDGEVDATAPSRGASSSRRARASCARRCAGRRSSAPGAVIEDAYIGPYSAISAGVVVRRAEVEHSILLEDSRVEDLDARVESSLIGRGVDDRAHRTTSRAPTGSWSATPRRSGSSRGEGAGHRRGRACSGGTWSRHLAGRHEVTAVDLDVDVTDPAAVRGLRAPGCRPEAVFHLAAWTDVDGAEAHEAEAARGQRATARATSRRPPPRSAPALVLPSTDYVFDGRKGAPYAEDDAPAPAGRLRPHQARGRARGARGATPAGRGWPARPGSTAPAGATSSTRCAGWGPSATRWRSWTTRRARPPGPATSPPPWRRCSTSPPGVYHAAGARLGDLGRPRARRSSRRPACACRVRPITTGRSGAPGAPAALLGRWRVTRPGAPRLRALARGPARTTWRRRREAAGHRRLRLHRLGSSCAWRWRAAPRW